MTDLTGTFTKVIILYWLSNVWLYHPSKATSWLYTTMVIENKEQPRIFLNNKLGSILLPLHKKLCFGYVHETMKLYTNNLA